jgi:hypothetical protein
MKASRADRFRIFLANRPFTSFFGMAADEWFKPFRKRGFAVDAPYMPRAALMTLTSVLTFLIWANENRKSCLLAAALGTPLASQAVGNARLVKEGLWRYLWVVLAQEAVRLALVLYAAFTDEVVWRRRRMRVASDGTVELVGRKLR